MYDKELENVEVYQKFQDLVKTFELHRGKVKPGEDATVVGEFKVNSNYNESKKDCQLSLLFGLILQGRIQGW